MLLRAADNHRSASKGSIDRIVQDIRNGQFQYTGDSIKFDGEGYLLDGRNRLSAIVKTGATLDLMIATGINDKARYVIDTGKTYTLKNALEAEGVPRAQHVAMALTAVQAWERGDHTSEPAVGATTINTSLTFLRENFRIHEVAAEAKRLQTKITALSGKQLAALVWAFDNADKDRTEFFAKIINGHDLTPTDSIFQLRQIFAANEQQRTHSSRTLLALTIKAWNRYRSNQQMNELTFNGGGTAPEDFPIPA
jgi:hypothetical protein